MEIDWKGATPFLFPPDSLPVAVNALISRREVKNEECVRKGFLSSKLRRIVGHRAGMQGLEHSEGRFQPRILEVREFRGWEAEGRLRGAESVQAPGSAVVEAHDR